MSKVFVMPGMPAEYKEDEREKPQASVNIQPLVVSAAGSFIPPSEKKD